MHVVLIFSFKKYDVFAVHCKVAHEGDGRDMKLHFRTGKRILLRKSASRKLVPTLCK